MMGRDLDVVVVGNAGIDTQVYLHGADIDFSVESNFTENIDCVGQAGAYASRGYTRLGKRTSFIGHVGDDPCGKWVRDTFARDGIDTSALFVDPSGTSRSINFMYRDGRRKNFYDGKSHVHLRPDLEVCRAVLARARLAHFNIPNWARLLLPVARESGLTIACDIQDTVTADDKYRHDFIEYADVLFFSAVNHEDPTELMKQFMAGNPARVVVAGMGAKGCAAGRGGEVAFFPAVDLDEPVIDANGAGDGLAVGFLSSYVLEGRPLVESIWRGQIAARYTCTQRASSSSLITSKQLESLYLERLVRV